MEAKELMIGNWCAYGVNCKGRVTALTEHLITLSVDGNEINGLYMLMPDMVRPIPLTEEILEKNGFEKNHNDEAPAEECYFYRLFAKPCGWFDIDAFGLEEELGAEFTYNDININYVHQLQHLLRLCGIENEISI